MAHLPVDGRSDGKTAQQFADQPFGRVDAAARLLAAQKIQNRAQTDQGSWTQEHQTVGRWNWKERDQIKINLAANSPTWSRVRIARKERQVVVETNREQILILLIIGNCSNDYNLLKQATAQGNAGAYLVQVR